MGFIMSFRLVIFMGVLLFAQRTAAQESVEDRMRDALRQSVTEMRAAQDQAAQAQADLQKAQADKAALQTQLDAANARLAAAPAIKPAELEALKAQLQQAQQASNGLQQLNTKLQASLESAAAAAQAKDAQGRKDAAAIKATSTALEACKSANGQLINVSEDVLHLYESQSFHSLLLKSYEPVLGLWKVKLENIVQQYDDKIQSQAYLK
jgi:septal ring factor EnvC (AmiA/AmiB activator)